MRLKHFFIFIKFVVLLLGFLWLANNPGTLLINWQNYQLEASLGAAAFVLIASVFFLLFIASLIRNARLWFKESENKKSQRLQAGIIELEKAYAAMEGKTPQQALEHIVHARQKLKHSALPGLFEEHILQSEMPLRKPDYTAVQHIKTSEPLVVREKIHELEAKKDWPAIETLLAGLAPENQKKPWFLRSQFFYFKNTQNWHKALDVLENKDAQKSFTEKERSHHISQMLHAIGKQTSQDEKTQQKLFAKACAQDPSNVEAVMDYATQCITQGKYGDAEKLVQSTWKKETHWRLATFYSQLTQDKPLSPLDQVHRMRKLHDTTSDDSTSGFCLVSFLIQAGLWGDASHLLDQLPRNETHAFLSLMLNLQEKEGQSSCLKEILAFARNLSHINVDLRLFETNS